MGVGVAACCPTHTSLSGKLGIMVPGNYTNEYQKKRDNGNSNGQLSVERLGQFPMDGWLYLGYSATLGKLLRIRMSCR